MTALPNITADPYEAFLRAKIGFAPTSGFEVSDEEINPLLFPFQRAIVRWACAGGRRAVFAAFGLGKSLIQIEIVRLCHLHLLRTAGREADTLTCVPLGVRQEFRRDGMLDTDKLRERAAELGLDHADLAARFGVEFRFVRRGAEMDHGHHFYLTNYESIRDGRLDPALFQVMTMDEADVLRSFGSKTFGEFQFGAAARVPLRFVATATPSPNEYLELIAYAHFLGVMDMGESKTRFFRRNSEKADNLTLHPHKEREFWLWVASWALFVQKPSDLGPEYSDAGYDLPDLRVITHVVPVDHQAADVAPRVQKNGQAVLLRDASLGVSEAAQEKRSTLAARVARMREIIEAAPDDHWLIWHDLEDERRAIERAVPGVVTVYGSMDLEERERRLLDFADGRTQRFGAKPSIAGAGNNFQRHCHKEIFLGVGYKFRDFLQGIHRVYRFLQPEEVELHIIYAESERPVWDALCAKWERDKQMRLEMAEIVREYGLSRTGIDPLTRTMGVTRQEECGKDWRLVHNDAVLECRDRESMPDASVGMVLTSIPFGGQYEYTPSYHDLGHTDTSAHFWAQMDFLTPNLLRVLKPGRVACVHVKDRVVPGGITGLGFQTIAPFHAEAIFHYLKHGFQFLGMCSIATDVVRENNGSYRLSYTQQCKDGTRMGFGMSEFVLAFRRPPTDASDGYADEPVVKPKDDYSLGRWQIDAHGVWKSSGDRLLTAADFDGLPMKACYRLWREACRSGAYDYARHVEVAEALRERGMLPTDFGLVPPHCEGREDVWTDVARMRTLNSSQSARNQQMHLCLARGSLVLTKGGYKPIQDVQVGDLVLTHKGRWRSVSVVRNTGVRPVVTITAQGVPGLTLTPDHKLWTRTVRDIPWARAHSRREAANTPPDWVEAQETVGSYVNSILPDPETPTETDLTYWWVVGRWLADGHLSKHGGAIISCGFHEVDDLSVRLQAFGGNPFHHTKTAAQVLLKDPGHRLRRVLGECGTGAHNKRLPAEAHTLPAEQARALLAGYLSGDGHFLASRRRWMASSVSKELLLGIAALVQRVHGTIASVYPGRIARECVIQGRSVQAKDDWSLCFDLPSEARRKPAFILDDGAWKKVRSVQDAGEAETWCLRVEEDESFTAEGCVVKNCPFPFDIVERLIERFTAPGDLVFDPFSGIGTVAYCAVKMGRRALGTELNPGYFADSLGYVRAAAEQRAVPSLFDLMDEAEEADEPPMLDAGVSGPANFAGPEPVAARELLGLEALA